MLYLQQPNTQKLNIYIFDKDNKIIAKSIIKASYLKGAIVFLSGFLLNENECSILPDKILITSSNSPYSIILRYEQQGKI